MEVGPEVDRVSWANACLGGWGSFFPIVFCVYYMLLVMSIHMDEFLQSCLRLMRRLPKDLERAWPFPLSLALSVRKRECMRMNACAIL